MAKKKMSKGMSMSSSRVDESKSGQGHSENTKDAVKKSGCSQKQM